LVDMQQMERIVMVVITVALIAGGAWLYAGVTEEQAARERIQAEVNAEAAAEPDWKEFYPVTVPITIGGVPVLASVADSLPERIQGLSNTPYLPAHVVKLFAFGSAGEHPIWMKDMNYAIDIFWTDEAGTIVHLEESVSPDTFPQSFASPEPAWYVVESQAGFAASNSIAVGDAVVLPWEE
jgi:uncharacterized membrane protein (UPF0127 family)